VRSFESVGLDASPDELVAEAHKGAATPEVDLRIWVESVAKPSLGVDVPTDSTVLLPNLLLHFCSDVGHELVFGSLRDFNERSRDSELSLAKLVQNRLDQSEHQGDLAFRGEENGRMSSGGLRTHQPEEVRETGDSGRLEVLDSVPVELILKLDTFIVVNLEREKEVHHSEASSENDDVGLDFASVLRVHLVTLRVSDHVVGDQFHVVRMKSLVVTAVEHSSLRSDIEIRLENIPVLLGCSLMDVFNSILDSLLTSLLTLLNIDDLEVRFHSEEDHRSKEPTESRYPSHEETKKPIIGNSDSTKNRLTRTSDLSD